jgi:hypothetical protein
MSFSKMNHFVKCYLILVDLVPNGNIMNFIASDPNVTFLVARQDYETDNDGSSRKQTKDNDSNHNCAWDGFIATQPGHPIIRSMIESIIESVLVFGYHKNNTSNSNRHPRNNNNNDNDYIFESMVLRKSNNPLDLPLWKLRRTTVDSYLFTGCSIGLAINRVTLKNQDLLADLPLGKQLIPNTDGKYINILMVRANFYSTTEGRVVCF